MLYPRCQVTVLNSGSGHFRFEAQPFRYVLLDLRLVTVDEHMASSTLLRESSML